jgi:hypothetical protein
MQSICEFVKKLDELSPNPTEFLFFDKQITFENELGIECALTSWAFLYEHKLRLPSQRNPFTALSSEDLKLKIYNRLTEELVFRGDGASTEQAQSLVSALIVSSGAIDALFSDFLIDDWTFCELLLVRCNVGGFILSFLGED